MKLSFTILVCFALGAASASNLTEESRSKAQAVIDAAIVAYGGAKELRELTTLTIKTEVLGVSQGQSRRPEPPWDRTATNNMAAVDTENGILVTRNQGTAGGFVFDNGTIIDGETAYQLDFRAGTAAPLVDPDFDTQSGPFVRVTPVLLVKQLQGRGNTSHWLGEVDLDGRGHDVITLVMAVGPALSLYFDQESHLLSKSERVIPQFGLIEYLFSDYQSVDGIPINRHFELRVNGEKNSEQKLTSAKINAPLTELAKLPSGLDSVDPVGPDELALQELAEGVYHVGGTGTYALFVDMGEYIVAVGGTAGIVERIAELRKVVQDKPIRYAVMTHHHSDHVLGMPAYVAEGATVLTVRENETVLREAAGDAGVPNFEFVDRSRSLGNGSKTVEIHDLGPTPHAEHLLVAYLPAQGIVFEADHFPLPRTGPMPPAIPNTQAFAAAMAQRGFKVQRIVGAHSPRVATMDDLQTALARATQLVESVGGSR